MGFLLLLLLLVVVVACVVGGCCCCSFLHHCGLFHMDFQHSSAFSGTNATDSWFFFSPGKSFLISCFFFLRPGLDNTPCAVCKLFDARQNSFLIHPPVLLNQRHF